ncbi:MAG: TlpA family protein disulfide reductase [Bacteroidales bacterium]|nr:TlpA family protein disulfide reductase [Bacteroidales bacterium]
MNFFFRMRYLIVIYLIGLFATPDLSGKEVIIKGQSPSYAHEIIKLYQYSDQITNTEKLISECIVAGDGNFELSFDIDATTYVFSRLGVYTVYLFVEPGKTYNVVLPQKTPKSEKDLLNPYFEEVAVHLGLTNYSESELNMLIRMFNDAFNPYYKKHIYLIATGQDLMQLDKDIESIEVPFTSYSNEFFKSYREYKYAMLRHLAAQQKAKSISDMYFLNKPVLYNNPVFMELFNQIYEKYFQYFSRTTAGEKIYADINDQKSLKSLKNTLSQDEVLKNDTLLELVILKGLHDEFYNNLFSRTAMLEVLDSLISSTKLSVHKEIGINVRNKVTKLMTGFAPPDFKLYDIDSNLFSLENFKGKYLYINFCMSYSYTCLNDFDMLSGIYQRHKDLIEIVSILLDQSEKNLKDIIKKNDYHWVFLQYGNQPEIIKEYDIRGIPTYFLIDPEGKLVLSPAPGPSENFETALFKTLKARGDL